MQPKESNSSKHFRISVLKSGIRMFACAALMYSSFFTAGCLFFIAECFGVIEEL
jgi:hypothetical protein